MSSFTLQAPRPSAGPHKVRECLPLMIFLRNRLKYALTYTECKKILNQRLVKVDGKVRTDNTYPSGFMGKLVIVSNNNVIVSRNLVIYPPFLLNNRWLLTCTKEVECIFLLGVCVFPHFLDGN